MTKPNEKNPFKGSERIRAALEKAKKRVDGLPPGLLENVAHSAGVGLVGMLTGKHPDPFDAFTRPLYGAVAQSAVDWIRAAPGDSVEVWAEEKGARRPFDMHVGKETKP